MLIISQKVFDEIAAKRRADCEVPFVIQTIRERGDPLARALSEELLLREVRATLRVCDKHALTSDVDRVTFCLLEITRFAGLRDVPKLGGLLNYAGGPPDARVQALLATMPPPVWQQIGQAAPVIRARRGWV